MTSAKHSSPLIQRRGTKIYFAASAVAQFCALVRYTLLARLLGPEQLGLAAVLVLVGQFFDTISDSGGDRFLIQDKDGDSEDVQKLVQLSFVLRGIVIALSLLIFSRPIANLFGVPILAVSFTVLAIPPIISGLLHLDIRRSQRRHDFRAEGTATLLAESGSMIATTIAAYLLRNYTAVLYGLIIRALITVAVSHWSAERKYRIGYMREHAARLARFAFPLIFNGLLLFFGGQSDRILVSREIGITELGRYSAVLLLIYYPSAMLMKNLGAIHLPRIAAAAAKSVADADRRRDEMASQTILLAMGMAFGFAVTAPIAIPILYGHRFTQVEIIVILIGILQTSRFARQWPTTVALALGRSSILLTSNIVRLIGYPLAIAAGWWTKSLPMLVGGLALGELVALAWALACLNIGDQRHVFFGFRRFFMFIIGCAVLIAWGITPIRNWTVAGGLSVVSLILAYDLFTHEKATLEMLKHKLRNARRR